MSKSAPDEQSRILLTDDSNTIRKKIRAAVTDSLGNITYDPINRRGTVNLLTILAACRGENDIEKVAEDYRGKNHGALKDDVISAVDELLKGPRAEFERLRADTGYLEQVSLDGAARARDISHKTMQEVRKHVGLA